METLIESLASIFTLDNSYLEIVVLSLYISVIATIVSAFFAIFLASHMASSQFFGKDTITIIVNTLMSMPPSKRGAPSNHEIPIREVRLSAGAEFIVMVCGDIMTMPGLPKVPAAERIDIDDDGNIVGLF